MEDILEPHGLTITPGQLLQEEFLEPMGITAYRLAKEIHVPAGRIGQIIHGQRAITADTDLRLCRFFGLTEGYWLRAQVEYDLEVTRTKLDEEIKSINPWNPAA